MLRQIFKSIDKRKAGKQNGALPESFSFVSVDKPNAVITAVKRAEADDGLIVRFYDAYDCKSSVALTAPSIYKKAYLCDLCESEIREIELIDGKTTLDVKNFEIVTVKFKR